MDLEQTESDGRWHALAHNDWRVQLVTQLARIATALEGTHVTTITAPAGGSITLTRPPRETTHEPPPPPARVPFPLKSISRTASGGCIVRITAPMSEVAWWGRDPDHDPPLMIGGPDGTYTHQIPCPYTEGFLGGFAMGEEDPDGFAPLYSTTLLDIAAELAKAERGAS